MDLVDGPDLHRYLRENGPLTPVAASLLTAADRGRARRQPRRRRRPPRPEARQRAASDTRTATDAPDAHRLRHRPARRLPGADRTHEFVGTPAYVAPESAEGRPQTSAVDIYGAGILLYELVTGRRRSRRHRARSAAPAPQRGAPPPHTVPAPLWTVIERCLSKDPDQRPSAENLARALRTVAAGIGVHANPAADRGRDGGGRPAGARPGARRGRSRGARDPAASRPTQVLPGKRGRTTRTRPPASCSTTPARAAPPTAAVMPPVPRGPEGPPQPDGPHPWQSQLRRPATATSRRRSSTSTRAQDPLRRRPRRRQQRPAAAAAAPHGQQPYAQPPRQQRGQGQATPGRAARSGTRLPAAATAAPPAAAAATPPYEPQRPAPAPNRRADTPPREPRRSANPTKIPGLGCLKGCLTVVLLVVVIFVISGRPPRCRTG